MINIFSLESESLFTQLFLLNNELKIDWQWEIFLHIEQTLLVPPFCIQEMNTD